MGFRFLAAFLLLISSTAFAEELRVGVKVAEPFVTNGGTTYTGDAIDVWENTFTGTSNYVQYPTVDALLQALAVGEVDVAVGAISITPEREALVDFMVPFEQTGLTYAAMEQEDLLAIFMDVVPTIIFGVSMIFVVMAGAGALFALLEHKRNDDVESKWDAIFTGVYWSTATITTVGYGDVHAKTAAGRFFSVIWMWAGLIIAGSLTGLIVTSANVQTAGIDTFNIQRADIAVVEGSAGLHFVEKIAPERNIHTFESLEAAVAAVASGKLDAVVHDEALLNHMSGQYPELYVSAETFNSDYYAFAVPQGSWQREELNRSLLENNKF